VPIWHKVFSYSYAHFREGCDLQSFFLFNCVFYLTGHAKDIAEIMSEFLEKEIIISKVKPFDRNNNEIVCASDNEKMERKNGRFHGDRRQQRRKSGECHEMSTCWQQ